MLVNLNLLNVNAIFKQISKKKKQKTTAIIQSKKSKAASLE